MQNVLIKKLLSDGHVSVYRIHYVQNPECGERKKCKYLTEKKQLRSQILNKMTETQSLKCRHRKHYRAIDPRSSINSNMLQENKMRQLEEDL